MKDGHDSEGADMNQKTQGGLDWRSAESRR